MPFLAASATLTPGDIEAVAETLWFDKRQTFIINLGNDRPNVTQAVIWMKGTMKAELKYLDFVIHNCKIDGIIKKALIFVNEIKQTTYILQYLHSLLPEEEYYLLTTFYANQEERSKW